MHDDRTLDHLAGELNRLYPALDDCANLIRDLELNPKTNVRRIGQALSLIFEIDEEIYTQRPDLRSRVTKKEWSQAREFLTECAVRPATLEDEPTVLSLIEELFEPPGVRPPGYSVERGKAGLHHAVLDPSADVLLAIDGDAIIGLASVYADILSIRYGPRCWLQDLIVTKDYRSKGAGNALLAAAIEWAGDHGCTHLELSSGAGRVDAHRFYRREGMSQSYNFSKQLE